MIDLEESASHPSPSPRGSASSQSCSTSSPGGNLVDGLPPVAHTGAVVFCRPMPLISCPVVRAFVGLVLAIPLVDLNETLGNTRYMYDLNFCKVSLLSIHLARSLSHPKHRIGPLHFHDVRGFGLERPSTHSKSPILAPESRADAQC